MFKFLLVMKLIIVLLTTAIMQVSAATYAQKVTLTAKNAPLAKVFKEITQQTNYTFLYTAQMLDNTKPVTVNIKGLSLEDALKQCFDGQPVTYTIKNQVIVVAVKETRVPEKSNTELPPTKEYHNIVLNTNQERLPNASITIKRTKAGTLTNSSGYFKIDVLPGDTLIVSYIGYQSVVVPVDTWGEKSIIMHEATNSLDQVVVQAYGETSQRLTTSDIGKVTAADIEKQPVMNVLEALQGKVAGLDVTQTSGYASAPFKVEIRGRSAINSGFAADPLYIVDGVPLTVLEIAGNDAQRYKYGSTGFIQNGTGVPAGGQSPLFSLNPSDIQSIEVLKDADATAIYGSRGANGVILITTKKGKVGKMSLDAYINEGVTHVTRYWDMLNTQQYVAMRKEALKNYGLAPDPAVDYDINGTWDTTRYTDWQKALFGGWGKSTDAQAAISGGSAQTVYRVGFGYAKTTDITTVSGSDQRGSLSFNLSSKSPDNQFTFTFSGNYTYTRSDMVSLPAAITLAPDAPAIFDAQGNLNFGGWGGADNNVNARGAFPFATLEQPYVSTTNFLTSSVLLSYQVVKGLNASIHVGYNNAQADQTQLVPLASIDPFFGGTATSTWGYNSNKNWIIEPLITYNSNIGNGTLNAVMGASEQQTNTDGISVQGSGYTNDDLIQSLASAPTIRLGNQNSGEYRYNAIFGRISYNWQNKYLLNLNGRRDGSSRFGPGKQFGNFGSVGAAWIFTEEKWLKDHLSFLSFGKLRGSYGTTGSDGVGDYQFLTQYSSVGTLPYGGTPSLKPTLEANPNFHWQVNTKLEGAVNLGFFHDRVDFQMAYYRDRTGNQLIQYPLPALTGFSYVTANSNALVQNSGLEFTAAFKVLDGNRFKWTMDFDLSVNHNKLLAYPNLAQSPYASTYDIGQPLNIYHELKYTGVDPLTGLYTFYDKNHDGVITYNPSHPNDDDTYLVDVDPKFFGGISMNFSYDNFALSMFFNFKKQIGINAFQNTQIPGSLNYNQPVEVLNRWQKPGDSNPYALFTPQDASGTFFPFFANSSGIYTDASYIRLSNLSLSYNLPSKWLKRIGVQRLSLFVHANNLLTITDYKGIDPETQNFGGLPPTRTIVGGLSFNF
jgi:TonB-linked SusC/RagA family outer membrane protein